MPSPTKSQPAAASVVAVHVFEDDDVDDYDDYGAISYSYNDTDTDDDDDLISAVSKDTAQTFVSESLAGLSFETTTTIDPNIKNLSIISSDERYDVVTTTRRTTSSSSSDDDEKELMKFRAIEYIKSFKRKLSKANKKNEKLIEKNKQLETKLIQKSVTYKLLVKSELTKKGLRSEIDDLKLQLERQNTMFRLSEKTSKNQQQSQQEYITELEISKEKLQEECQRHIVKIVQLAKENTHLKAKNLDSAMNHSTELEKLKEENEQLRLQLLQQQQQQQQQKKEEDSASSQA